MRIERPAAPHAQTPSTTAIEGVSREELAKAVSARRVVSQAAYAARFAPQAPAAEASVSTAEGGEGGSSVAAAAGVQGLRSALHHEALTTFGEPPWDAVTRLRCEAAGALTDWCAAREGEGARVLALRVSEHETPLPRAGVP